MEYLVGIALALGVSLGGTVFGFDRDRSFYPATTLAIASSETLFAVIGGSTHARNMETAAFLLADRRCTCGAIRKRCRI